MIKEILNDRKKKYGIFKGHAQITQNLKSIMRESPNWCRLSTAKKEALEMTVHKIGRILNGDPFYKDSWDDIIGYITLITDDPAEVFAEKEKEVEENAKVNTRNL